MTGPALITLTAQQANQSVPVPPEDWVPPSIADPTSVHRVQVAVSSIRSPGRRWLGELLRARVEDGHSENLDGGGSCRISVPVTDPSLDLVGTDFTIWGGNLTYKLQTLNRAFHLVEDGKVTGCYVPRGPVTVKDGVATFDCQAPTALFQGRTLGDSRSTDLMLNRGNFPEGFTLGQLGFTWVGDPGDVEFTDGLRDGQGLRIRGDSLTNKLRFHVGMSTASVTNFNNIIRAAAFMSLPDDAREGRTVMELETFSGGDRYWPEPGDGNPEAAVVEDDTPLGKWGDDPVTAKSILPKGPYTAQVRVTIYPQSVSEWTYIDELTVFQRDNLSTGDAKDLSHHLRILALDAQDESKGKTTYNLPVVVGSLTGIVEKGTWWREDNQPHQDAVEAIVSRAGGPDAPYVDKQWRYRIVARRGSIRDDLTIGPDRIVSDEGWTYDPGAQVSEVRAETDRGSDYWRHQAVARDTSRTAGHLIERITRAPNGMGLRQLDQWVAADLYQKSQAQETCTIWVDFETGWRINVGDTFRLLQQQGLLRMDRTVRVIERAFHESKRLVALQVGTDEEAA